MTYAEKLKDPRWQRRRLEILNKYNFTCRLCFDDEMTLHIHHLYYTKGKEPWEYPDEALEPLCSYCHALKEDLKSSKGNIVILCVEKTNIRINEDIVLYKILRHNNRKELKDDIYFETINKNGNTETIKPLTIVPVNALDQAFFMYKLVTHGE